MTTKTKREQTKLETLQREYDGMGFIMSYPILNQIKELSPTDTKLIELVLSYQDKGQAFKMSFQKIGAVLNIAPKTVSNIVLKLTKLKIIITDHKKNNVVNGVGRGSSTDLAVDLKRVIEMIGFGEAKETEPTPPAAPEPIQEPEPFKPAFHVKTPAIEIEPSTPENEPAQTKDKKRDEMEQRFNDKFRYGLQGRSMTPAEFHNLTFDKFKEIPKVWNKISNLPNDDFDLFWLKVQELKAVLTTSDVLTQQQKELLDNEIRITVNENLLRTTTRTVEMCSGFKDLLPDSTNFNWGKSNKHVIEINDYIDKNYKRILKEMIFNEKEFEGNLKNNVTGNLVTIKYMFRPDTGKDYVDHQETITRND